MLRKLADKIYLLIMLAQRFMAYAYISKAANYTAFIEALDIVFNPKKNTCCVAPPEYIQARLPYGRHVLSKTQISGRGL